MQTCWQQYFQSKIIKSLHILVISRSRVISSASGYCVPSAFGQMYTSQSQAEVRGWYGLGPDLANGIGHYVQDDNLPKRHWNMNSRTAYNYSHRGMTPVWNAGNRILWLGGQPAANCVQNLKHCGIKNRQSALGTWGCKKTAGINDMAPFWVNKCLLDKRGLPVSDFDPQHLRSALHRIDMALQEGSVLVFCKQGYRLGPGDTALGQ